MIIIILSIFLLFISTIVFALTIGDKPDKSNDRFTF